MTATSVIKYWERTHTCGDLTAADTGKDVLLCGWVDTRRDHGGLIFIDLRDRYGITQVVLRPTVEKGEELIELGGDLRNEWVIAIKGRVGNRPADMVNPRLHTGEVEVEVHELAILSQAKTPPFVIEDEVEANENLRLKYRYLDLRRPVLQKIMQVRHQFNQITRNYLSDLNFLEIETPILFKSTPEGARDYLVPSRVNPGSFYALPQSPQILKQLLMVAGMDRYFQIARCFRDEDLRADRQPEFSQIDIEMSFATQNQVFDVVEGLMTRIWKEIRGMNLETPFRVMSYAEAMENYGVDKPDTRFELLLKDAGKVFADSEFKAFRSVLDAGGKVKGICVPGAATGDDAFTRKNFDDLTAYVANYGAKGLAWFKVGDSDAAGVPDLQSPITKFLSDHEKKLLVQEMGAGAGDIIMLVADKDVHVVYGALGALRLRVGEMRKMIDESRYDFLWVTDFPLFEWDPDTKRHVAKHHPFTEPAPEDVDSLLRGENLDNLRAAAYDLVLNGNEIAGGSIRIHRSEIQEATFRALQLSDAEVQEQFGFFVEALQYGTPPHGGIAFGVERNVMLLAGTEAIRDVMAFPKTQRASCLMSECPSKVSVEQLTDLHIGVLKKQTPAPE